MWEFKYLKKIPTFKYSMGNLYLCICLHQSCSTGLPSKWAHYLSKASSTKCIITVGRQLFVLRQFQECAENLFDTWGEHHLCLYFWWSWFELFFRARLSSAESACALVVNPHLSSSCDTCSFFCDVMAHLMSAEVQEELLWWKWPTGIPRQIPPGRWWWGWTPQLLPAQSNPALWRTPRALQAALLRSGQFWFF